MAAMTYDEVMVRLRDLGDERLRAMNAMNAKNGVGENQFGVKMGDLRAIAKEIKTDPALAETLWASGNFEAMMIATLIMKPKQLTVDDLDRLVASAPSTQVADWLVTNVIKQNPHREARREAWMNSEHPMTARLGWSLTAERIVKTPEGLNLSGLLTRIEAEMGDAPSAVQWTMNYCLAEIGINFPALRERALAIGEKIGAFRDYPTSKGCTSPFAPLWIHEMVRRQG